MIGAYIFFGSRQIGPRQIGPRQIGPLADLAANWAPHFLGPNLPFFGKSGPGRLGPLAANWAPANRAPADWAPWRQIGPLGNFVAANWAPWKFCCDKLGPGNFECGKLGPGNFVGGKLGLSNFLRQIGPRQIRPRQIEPWQIWPRQIGPDKLCPTNFLVLQIGPRIFGQYPNSAHMILTPPPLLHPLRDCEQ